MCRIIASIPPYFFWHILHLCSAVISSWTRFWWTCRDCFDANDLPQASHLFSAAIKKMNNAKLFGKWHRMNNDLRFLSLCWARCFFSTVLLRNCLSQMSHVTGFGFSCTALMCDSRRFFRPNWSPQWVQVYAFSPVWWNKCALSWVDWMNDLGQ